MIVFTDTNVEITEYLEPLPEVNLLNTYQVPVDCDIKRFITVSNPSILDSNEVFLLTLLANREEVKIFEMYVCVTVTDAKEIFSSTKGQCGSIWKMHRQVYNIFVVSLIDFSSKKVLIQFL